LLSCLRLSKESWRNPHIAAILREDEEQASAVPATQMHGHEPPVALSTFNVSPELRISMLRKLNEWYKDHAGMDIQTAGLQSAEYKISISNACVDEQGYKDQILAHVSTTTSPTTLALRKQLSAELKQSAQHGVVDDAPAPRLLKPCYIQMFANTFVKDEVMHAAAIQFTDEHTALSGQVARDLGIYAADRFEGIFGSMSYASLAGHDHNDPHGALDK
jgi:hypothetical protein